MDPSCCSKLAAVPSGAEREHVESAHTISALSQAIGQFQLSASASSTADTNAPGQAHIQLALLVFTSI